jgi:hypothetical protein
MLFTTGSFYPIQSLINSFLKNIGPSVFSSYAPGACDGRSVQRLDLEGKISLQKER